MKKIFLAIAIAAAMNTAQAQIIVTDPISIAKDAAEFAENVVRWKRQFEEMQAQLKQAEEQFKALTGGRGLGTILNDPRYREYLPTEWQGVYDAVRNGGYSGLSGRAAGIYSENQIYDACAHLNIDSQRLTCESQAVKGAQDKAFALDAYDAARARLNQIDQLMARINTTQDPKDIAELQGRIAAEQAMIANEQTKLQMYAMVAEAEDRIQEQRRIEANAEVNARRGWVQPNKLNIGD